MADQKHPVQEPNPLSPGTDVLILRNPHDPQSENVVGTEVAFRPGAGFAGADLADVQYTSLAERVGDAEVH